METGYCELRSKEVINTADGRRLGRVCDIIFTFPEGKVLGIVVPGGRGWFRTEMFIDIHSIIKIGADVILVNVAPQPKPEKRHGNYCCSTEPECPIPPPPPPPTPPRRSYDEYE